MRYGAGLLLLTGIALALTAAPPASPQTLDDPEMLPADQPALWEPGGPEVNLDGL